VSVTIAVCALGWIAGWLLLGRVRPASDLAGTEPHTGTRRAGLRGVTVIVPARNEAMNITGLLEGLCDPDDPTSPPDRIIVVDDHSSDDTATLARRYQGVEVVAAPPLPDRWTGKSWACSTGAQHRAHTAPIEPPGPTEALPADAPEDVLVFLDADVRLDRAALAQVVARRDAHGGLVSVQPWHRTRRWYEQLSSLFNVVAVMGTAAGARSGPTGAFGPVLVTSRADYDRIGGHATVRSQVVEDLAIAQRYLDAALPVQVFRGGETIQFRMYPGGLRQLVEGWTKNFAAGAGSTRMLRLAATVLWITCLGSAAFALEDAVRGDLPVGVGISLYLAFVVQLLVMFRQVGSFGVLTAALYPIPLVFFVLVFIRSLWRTHVRHNVTWRGRAVSTAPDRG
jgi:4,4'-diaponeurosporenoate glycosyltransferase